MYIDNVVTTLNLINAELKDFEVSKLFSSIYNSKIDVEFMADEIDDINKYIRENDVDSIIHLFESKMAMSQEVFKDMVYSKTDSILQLVVDNVNNIQKTIDIYSLSDYERNAVLFADFDYKLKHDRLREWVKEMGDCYPAFDISSLYDFICNSTYPKKGEFLNIIDGIHNVKYSIHNLNDSPWYDEDKEVRLKSLKKYEQQYFDIEKDWNQYLENYLLDNMPSEYLSIITQKDIPRGI